MSDYATCVNFVLYFCWFKMTSLKEETDTSYFEDVMESLARSSVFFNSFLRTNKTCVRENWVALWTRSVKFFV